MAEFVTVIKERDRLHEAVYNGGRGCKECPLSSGKNGKNSDCMYFCIRYPEEAEKIIMKWSAEHPVETMKDRFFKMFPNALKRNNGIPRCCLHHLGWAERGRCNDFENCLQCWNRPYEE